MNQVIRALLIAAPFLYMGLIWILSSLPHDTIIRVSNHEFDKVFKESLHLIEFGILYVLGVLFLLMIDRFTIYTSRWAALLSFLYGVVDELHQYTVPYRSFSYFDMVKDLIGVIVMYLIITNTFFRQPPTQPGMALKRLQAYVKKNTPSK